MTTAEYYGLARPRGERHFSAAAAFALNAFRSLRRWARIRRTVHELSHLDDRMLNDIGLNRSTLFAAAREASAYRDRGHGGF